ncbi:MAG: DUF3078 domain-containing protein [Bacteroidales bacterium]|nr:DUF3078 domain-containing protein [Bacteroidales bacterium]
MERIREGMVLMPVILLFFGGVRTSATAISLTDTLQMNDSASYTRINALASLQINQISLSNWAEGGESNWSGITFGKFNLLYRKDKMKVEFTTHLGYGLSWSKEHGRRKSDDRVDLSVGFGYSAFKKWYYSSVVKFKSQFSKGYKYPDDSTVVSDLLSPANVFASLGLEYKPADYASVFLSPASGRFILVMNQELADKGAYGVTQAVRNDSGCVIVPGRNLRAEFGINVILNLRRDIMRNVNLDSKLNLFNNYLDEDTGNRWNIDVDWETAFNFKINSYLSSNLFLHFLYDHEVAIPTVEMMDGKKVEVGVGPKLQFREHFGIGLSVKV